MIMWIAAIVLVALTVGAGYRQGAIRAAFSLLGALVAAALALTVAPLFNFIFRFINVHPAVQPFITALIGFVALCVVFTVVGSFVYRKVDHHYRYAVTDAQRAFWERMHRRVGACVGALTGLIYFLVFAVFVNVGGYFGYQTGGDESGSKVLNLVTKAAQDLKETRMDRVVGSYNPAPPKYYEVSDFLGLLYHNRPLKSRIQNYPIFAAMAERPIFHDLGADTEAQRALDSGKLEDMLANPKIHEVVTNAELYQEFMALDLKDIEQYLRTGVSPKFADQKILGRWGYDLDATLQLNKRAQPDIPATVWVKLKRELADRLNRSIFTAFHNNKAILQLSSAAEGKSSPMQAAGLNRQRETNYVAVWMNTNASYSATGNWSGASPNYLVTLGNRNGKATAEAAVQGNTKLIFKFEGTPVAFEKLPD